MEKDAHARRPRDIAEQTRIEFLDAEIDLCETFLKVALVDADHAEAAASYLDSKRDWKTSADEARRVVSFLRWMGRLVN
jgi:hypothetical protein